MKHIRTFKESSTTNYTEFEKTKNSDIFEKVIDDLILEKYSEDEELNSFIKALPVKDRRMSTLSLMSDDNVLLSKIYEIHRSDISRYNKIKQIILLLRDYVKIADVERKSHGEILTPFDELARPMVNLMNKYNPEFWKDPTNKVLDSSAGYGTFLILCLYKFMEGLKEFEPDEDLRLKHIIENQLYYGELQSKSVFAWLVTIDPNDEYHTNIYWGSFLEDGFDYHAKSVWGVEKWDLIIQNPPYQMQKEGFKKTQPLWHLFVQKSLTLLKEDMYMIMVHPSGWRNVDGVFKETQKLLKQNQILELNINNEKAGLKIFGAETRFDYYILSKKKYESDSVIKCQDGSIENVNFSKMEFIPNGMFSLFISLLANDGGKVNIISDSSYHTQRPHLSKDNNNIFKYPCVYTVKSGDVLTMWYSNTNKNGHFGQSKLIWSNFRISSAGSFIDENGEYGLTQFSYAILDSIDNLSNIKKAFDTKRFRDLMEICSVGDMSINRKVIATFRKDFWKEFI